MIAVKHSRHKGFQVIKDRLTYGRKAPLQARKRERKHGRDIIWTLRAMPAPEWVVENWPGSATVIAVRGKGSRDGKPTDETRYYVTSLRTGAEALLRHVRDRWSIENSWHWPRYTQLKEDAHRYREPNGVQIMATLRSLEWVPPLRGSAPPQRLTMGTVQKNQTTSVTMDPLLAPARGGVDQTSASRKRRPIS